MARNTVLNVRSITYYFHYGKHFIEYAERFRPFSLDPLLSKLYMYTFNLKNRKMKNFIKHTEFFQKVTMYHQEVTILNYYVMDNIKAQY